MERKEKRGKDTEELGADRGLIYSTILKDNNSYIISYSSLSMNLKKKIYKKE